MKKSISDYRKESILQKKMRFAEGIMTRREWLDLMRVKGADVEATNERNIAAEEKLKKWVYDNRDDNSGNPNWPATKNWLEKKKQSQEKIYRTKYYLNLPDESGMYEITKTEYDYFLNAQLSEDILTEKHDLSERVEAGLATEEEIQEDMDKEIAFMNKYFRP